MASDRPNATKVEAVAKALWRLDHPEDDMFSQAAPNDWDRWPETPRAASLCMEDHSRQEYREMALVAIAAMETLDAQP